MGQAPFVQTLNPQDDPLPPCERRQLNLGPWAAGDGTRVPGMLAQCTRPLLLPRWPPRPPAGCAQMWGGGRPGLLLHLSSSRNPFCDSHEAASERKPGREGLRGGRQCEAQWPSPPESVSSLGNRGSSFLPGSRNGFQSGSDGGLFTRTEASVNSSIPPPSSPSNPCLGSWPEGKQRGSWQVCADRTPLGCSKPSSGAVFGVRPWPHDRLPGECARQEGQPPLTQEHILPAARPPSRPPPTLSLRQPRGDWSPREAAVCSRLGPGQGVEGCS